MRGQTFLKSSSIVSCLFLLCYFVFVFFFFCNDDVLVLRTECLNFTSGAFARNWRTTTHMGREHEA